MLIVLQTAEKNRFLVCCSSAGWSVAAVTDIVSLSQVHPGMLRSADFQAHFTTAAPPSELEHQAMLFVGA